MSSRGRFLQSVVVVVVLAAAAACGGDGDDTDPSVASQAPSATSTPSPTAPATKAPTVPKVDCAKVFSQHDAEALAGARLGKPRSEAVSALPGCRWTSAKTGAWVQTLAVPASVWAKAIPAAIGTLLESHLEFEGRDELDEARRLIEGGGVIGNAEACRIFSTMVSSMQGQPVGSADVFNYVPSKADAQGINGQACVKGRYYSVQLVAPNLKPGPAVEKQIKQALASLAN